MHTRDRAPAMARAPMVPQGPKLPSAHDRVRIAARAGVDPKTVKRYLDGTVVPRSTTRSRIEKGLAACGFAECIRRSA